MSGPLSPELLDRFKALVGRKGFVDDPADIAPHLVEWRDRYKGASPLVLKPANTGEVAAILKLANETRTKIVPQGGNTGLVGGGIPFDTGDEIVLSLSRMNRIRELDAANNTITVEAGVTLAEVQSAAAEAGRLFPLSLAAEGTCQIGGNLSTNAGGTAVLKYGNTRDLTLGLEAVLADGRIWNGLRGLRKDNTGYDLKQLFIGAEGTLGVITAAVLKLYPVPEERATAFVSVPSVEAAVALLRAVEARSGGLVTTFELVPRIGLDFVTAHVEGARDPIAAPADWYVLMELSAGRSSNLDAVLTDALGEAAEEGLVLDAVLAASETQRAELWQLRETLSEVQKHEGGSIKHDVSVPVSKIAAFIEEASAAVQAACPGIRPVPFGHIGDGNVHFNLSQPVDADRDAYLARWEEIAALVHEIVRAHDGSISAEHGVGRMKRDEIAATKSPVEMEMMRGLKALLDPNGILNPGKVV